jgi:hypothetical protein
MFLYLRSGSRAAFSLESERKNSYRPGTVVLFKAITRLFLQIVPLLAVLICVVLMTVSVGQNSSVGIVTCYRLDLPGIESR